MSYLTDGNACNVFVRWPLVKTGRAGRPLARISWADLLEPVVCELPLAACASRGVPHPLSISRCERACGGSYSRTVQQRRRALRLLSMLRCSSCSFSGAAFCPPCFTSDSNPKRTSHVRHTNPLTPARSNNLEWSASEKPKQNSVVLRPIGPDFV